MERGTVENDSARRYDAEPRSAKSMSTKNTGVNESDATTDDEPTINHGDTIESLEAANVAVFDEGMVLRVQPPAPRATDYFALVEGKGWAHSQSHIVRGIDWGATTDDRVRRDVRTAINRESAVDTVRALDPAQCDRFGDEVRAGR